MSTRQSTGSDDVAGTATATVAVPAVELTDITKRFGPVVACDKVCLSVQRGEIHGLLGQNGAGKSTLMKILTGLVTPDSGHISIAGRRVEIKDPLVAAGLGISMVHQHFSLVGRMRVWENVTLGERGAVDRDAARRIVKEVGDKYGLLVDPDAYVENLSTGERQRVELIKCLHRDPDLLILDEPTSVLTLKESRELFSVLRRAAEEDGKTIILISHKLDEILHATDRVTIMRNGAVVAQKATCDTDVRELGREMVGRELSGRTAASAVGSLEELVGSGSPLSAANGTASGNGSTTEGARPRNKYKNKKARSTRASRDRAKAKARSRAKSRNRTRGARTSKNNRAKGPLEEPRPSAVAPEAPGTPDHATEPEEVKASTSGHTTEDTPEGATTPPADQTSETAETPPAEDTSETAGSSAGKRGRKASTGARAAAAAGACTPDFSKREVRLRIVDAHATAPDGRPLLRGLSLEVRAGEILGIAGVEGNGQSALGDLLSSLLDLDSGTVEVCGTAVRTGRPGAMHAAGVGVIPEDRHLSGCVLDMSVAENLVMADLGEVARRSFINPRRLRQRAVRLIEEFDISVPSPDTPMRLLSGGNQQKVVLARELAAAPKVLVAAQPTRGLDVGAIEYMTERLHRAAQDGIAVLLISTELEEILTLAHRIAVIHRGRIVGEMSRAEVDVERLGMMMGGQAA
ncbi:ABC transporter [Thermostaphylospora chromogena]|uniref:ABC transporter n=1 Tax=Thermostaphylospora chromogena TaxID=35622 RepID=A0A1H1D7C2_9ACTN|nr:ABC transporter [Thermostaphylospora chromogena]